MRGMTFPWTSLQIRHKSMQSLPKSMVWRYISTSDVKRLNPCSRFHEFRARLTRNGKFIRTSLFLFCLLLCFGNSECHSWRRFPNVFFVAPFEETTAIGTHVHKKETGHTKYKIRERKRTHLPVVKSQKVRGRASRSLFSVEFKPASDAGCFSRRWTNKNAWWFPFPTYVPW